MIRNKMKSLRKFGWRVSTCSTWALDNKSECSTLLLGKFINEKSGCSQEFLGLFIGDESDCSQLFLGQSMNDRSQLFAL